jgi:hypothetical protein
MSEFRAYIKLNSTVVHLNLRKEWDPTKVVAVGHKIWSTGDKMHVHLGTNM